MEVFSANGSRYLTEEIVPDVNLSSEFDGNRRLLQIRLKLLVLVKRKHLRTSKNFRLLGQVLG